MKKAIITTLIFSLITGCASVPQPEIYNYKINSKTKDKEVKKIENHKYEKIYVFNKDEKIVKVEKLSKKYDSIKSCENELEIDVINIKRRIKENDNNLSTDGYSHNNIIEVEKEIKGKYEIKKTSKEKNKNFQLKYNLIGFENNQNCYYSISVEYMPIKGSQLSHENKKILYYTAFGILLIPVALVVMIVVTPIDTLIKVVK